ncbi:hypothetical protein tb265_36410 [Gemmatimonadetes bacterium T265]|nr:hypothetical protein tb265_36410 [Gemmatimonadetes bacterium T265]
MNRAQFAYVAKRTLLRWGWRVERNIAAQRGWQHGRTYWDPEYLRRWGARPGTIIDVGVGNGTPQLYEAFPDAYLALVEPLAEFGPAIASILARRPGVLFPTAVGAVDEERDVFVERHDAQRTSFYTRHALEPARDVVSRRRIPVTTLDSLVRGRGLPTPFLLKIDAEGAELDVIRGAAETLRDTEFVVAEVSVLDRFAGGHTFADFVAAMAEAGFAARDILGIGRADTSEVTFLDLVFRRRAAGG